ncbi:MAG: helix-turn-helix transcriptional regulator [Bacteroidetes bacterium]|nr:helix-turn-helix transcriptional regulator [Bacteroidota bacterium]
MSNHAAEVMEEEMKRFFISFGIMVKYWRTKKNISQETMTDDLGLNMYKVEAGDENLTLTSIFKITKYLNTPPHRLLPYPMTEEKIHMVKEGIEKMQRLNRKRKKNKPQT